MKSIYKKWGFLAGITVLAALIFGFQDDLFQIAKNLDVFSSVYKEVNINYVDDINSAKMIKTGVDAMLDGLDPYTEFVPESEIEDYKLHYVSTQYGGIGAGIFAREGFARNIWMPVDESTLGIVLPRPNVQRVE